MPIGQQKRISQRSDLPIDLCEPLIDMSERFCLCHVVHKHNAISPAVVGACDGSESLLACCVPLQAGETNDKRNMNAGSEDEMDGSLMHLLLRHHFRERTPTHNLKLHHLAANVDRPESLRRVTYPHRRKTHAASFETEH